MQKNWKTLKIGRVSLTKIKPTIVVSLYARNAKELLHLIDADNSLSGTLLEIRYDLFRKTSREDLTLMLEGLNSRRISYIFTYRGDTMVGKEYYSIAIKNEAPAVDVDLNSQPVEFGSSVAIVSHHGSYGDVNARLLRKLLYSEGDVAKLAISYDDLEDFLKDSLLMLKEWGGAPKPVCFSPMGDVKFLRGIAAFLFSDIVYASYGKKKTAAGQLTKSDYENLFQFF